MKILKAISFLCVLFFAVVGVSYMNFVDGSNTLYMIIINSVKAYHGPWALIALVAMVVMAALYPVIKTKKVPTTINWKRCEAHLGFQLDNSPDGKVEVIVHLDKDSGLSERKLKPLAPNLNSFNCINNLFIVSGPLTKDEIIRLSHLKGVSRVVASRKLSLV